MAEPQVQTNVHNEMIKLQTEVHGLDKATSELTKLLNVAARSEKEADKFAHAMGKVKGSINGARGSIQGLAGLVGAGFGLHASVQLVERLNKETIALTASFAKYGQSAERVKDSVSSLGKELALTRDETMKLFGAYEKGFHYASLTGAANLLKNIRKATGSNADAMQQMQSVLGSIASMYPEMQQSIENLTDTDKERLAAQGRLLLMQNKISLAQYKTLQEYISGSDQRSSKEKEQIQTMQQLRKQFEEVGIVVGKAILPVMKQIADWLTKHQGAITSIAGFIGKWVIPLTLASKLIVGMGQNIGGLVSGVGGLFTKIGTGSKALKVLQGGSRGGGGGKGVLGTLMGSQKCLPVCSSGGSGSLVSDAMDMIGRRGKLGKATRIFGRKNALNFSRQVLGGKDATKMARYLRAAGPGMDPVSRVGMLKAARKAGVSRSGLSKMATGLRGMSGGSRGIASSALQVSKLGKLAKGASIGSIAALGGEMAFGALESHFEKKGNEKAAAGAGLGKSASTIGGAALTGAAIGSVIPGVGNVIGAAGGALIGTIIELPNIFKNTSKLLKGTKLGETVEGVWSDITKGAKGFARSMKGMFSSVWGGLKKAKAWLDGTWLGKANAAVGNAMKKAAGWVGGKLADGFKFLWKSSPVGAVLGHFAEQQKKYEAEMGAKTVENNKKYTETAIKKQDKQELEQTSKRQALVTGQSFDGKTRQDFLKQEADQAALIKKGEANVDAKLAPEFSKTALTTAKKESDLYEKEMADAREKLATEKKVEAKDISDEEVFKKMSKDRGDQDTSVGGEKLAEIIGAAKAKTANIEAARTKAMQDEVVEGQKLTDIMAKQNQLQMDIATGSKEQQIYAEAASNSAAAAVENVGAQYSRLLAVGGSDAEKAKARQSMMQADNKLLTKRSAIEGKLEYQENDRRKLVEETSKAAEKYARDRGASEQEIAEFVARELEGSAALKDADAAILKLRSEIAGVDQERVNLSKTALQTQQALTQSASGYASALEGALASQGELMTLLGTSGGGLQAMDATVEKTGIAIRGEMEKQKDLRQKAIDQQNDLIDKKMKEKSISRDAAVAELRNSQPFLDALAAEGQAETAINKGYQRIYNTMFARFNLAKQLLQAQAQLAQSAQGYAQAVIERISIFGGDPNDAKKAVSDSVQQIREQQTELDKAITEGEALVNKSPTEIAQFMRDQGVSEEEIAKFEKSNDKTAARRQLEAELLQLKGQKVALAKQESDIELSVLQVQERSKQLQQAEVQQVTTMISMLDSMGAGVGASAEMRMQAIQKIGGVIQTVDSQIAELEAQIVQDQKDGVEVDIQKQQKLKDLQLEKLRLGQEQINQSKALRDGWISAISAMTTGQGRIRKIMISNDQSLAQGLKYMDMIRSSASGATPQFKGEKVGFKTSEQFTGSFGDIKGRNEGQGYETPYGVDSKGIRRSQDKLRKGDVSGASNELVKETGRLAERASRKGQPALSIQGSPAAGAYYEQKKNPVPGVAKKSVSDEPTRRPQSPAGAVVAKKPQPKPAQPLPSEPTVDGREQNKSNRAVINLTCNFDIHVQDKAEILAKVTKEVENALESLSGQYGRLS